jgi:fatty acid-binding protein DegV
LVVCDDDDVADFAVRHAGWTRPSQTSQSLNGDVTEAYNQMEGFDQVIIVHSDSEHNPEGLETYQPGPGVTIITDHHH